MKLAGGLSCECCSMRMRMMVVMMRMRMMVMMIMVLILHSYKYGQYYNCCVLLVLLFGWSLSFRSSLRKR